LDRGYRRAVLDATVREPVRAVCPSYGVDIAVVARHGVIAHRRELIRDLLLLCQLTALLVIVGVALVRLTSRHNPGHTDGMVVARSIATAMALLGLLAYLTVFGHEFVRAATLARYLLCNQNPAGIEWPSGRRIRRALSLLAESNRANLVVFSGYKPFLGSGVPVAEGDGAFAMPLKGLLVRDNDTIQVDGSSPNGPVMPRGGQRSDRLRGTRRPPTPFTERELIDALAARLRALNLPGLRVDERLFVNGFDVPFVLDGRLWRPDGRPAVHVPRQAMDAALAAPHASLRHYLCAETTGWQGHLVATTFVRVVKLWDMLFVEVTACVLPPLGSRFYAVDRLNILTLRSRIWYAAVAAIAVARLLVTCPYRIVTAVLDTRTAPRRRHAHRDALGGRVMVDYGAWTSLREMAWVVDYRPLTSLPERARQDGLPMYYWPEELPQYFLKQDLTMHIEVVASQLSETLQEFLAEHHYDVGELNFAGPNIRFSNVGTSYNNYGVAAAMGAGAQGWSNTSHRQPAR
jgi:hypothetical protein